MVDREQVGYENTHSGNVAYNTLSSFGLVGYSSALSFSWTEIGFAFSYPEVEGQGAKATPSFTRDQAVNLGVWER